MLLAGVTVWLIYGIVWLLGYQPQVGHFLPFHLSGVIPGAVLSRWQTVSRWFSRHR